MTLREYVKMRVPIPSKWNIVDVYLAVSFKELVELGTAEKIAEYLKEIAIKNKKAAQQKGDAVSRRLYVSLENKIEASQKAAALHSSNDLTIILQKEGCKRAIILSKPMEVYISRTEVYYPRLTKEPLVENCYKTERGKVLHVHIETRVLA